LTADLFNLKDPAFDVAREKLREPGLLGFLLETITKAEAFTGFLLGEDENALTLLLNVVEKQSTEVRGMTAGGKNSLVDAVMSILMPQWVEKVTGMTDKALRHLKDKHLRILYVAERRGVPTGEESTADYDVKVSISEGVISTLTTNRETGETEKLEVHIDQFIFTSTDLRAPAELENRLDVIQIHDTTEQNARVRDAKLSKAAMLPSQARDYSENVKVAQAMMYLIDEEAGNLRVVVPYGPALSRILHDDETAVRRHTDKLLRMIRASARIHYRQRPIIMDGSTRFILAMPVDLFIVLGIAESSLSTTFGSVTSKMLQVVKFAKTLDPITTDGLLKAARADKKSELGSRDMVQKVVKELREKGILAAKFDQEGKQVKSYHGAYVYTVEGSAESLSIDSRLILEEAAKEFEAWYHRAPTNGLPPLEEEIEIRGQKVMAAGPLFKFSFEAAGKTPPGLAARIETALGISRDEPTRLEDSREGLTPPSFRPDLIRADDRQQEGATA
jgi:hypothetical protein